MNKFRDINQAINRVERQENVGRPRKPNMKALTVRMDTVLPDIPESVSGNGKTEERTKSEKT